MTSRPALLAPERLLEVVRDSPMTSIDLVVEDAAGRVLLGYRTNRPARDCWFVPGGRVLKGERLESAFVRISGAELGCAGRLREAEWLGVYEHFYEDNFAGTAGVPTHYIVLAYRWRKEVPFEALPREQHGRFRWFEIPDLLAAGDVHPNTKAYFQ